MGKEQLTLQNFKESQRNEHHHHTSQRDHIIAGTCRKAKARNSPDTGRSGQALDVDTFTHDRTGTQKADTGNHLRTKTGRIGSSAGNPILYKNHLADNHNHAGTQRHQNMGTQTGRAVRMFTLDTDYQTNHHGAGKPEQNLLVIHAQKIHIHSCCRRQKSHCHALHHDEHISYQL